MIPSSNDTSTTLASLSGSFTSNFHLIVFCTLLILTWSFLSVGMIRDDEGQKLPRSFAANLFYSLTFVGLYIALVIFVFISPDIINGLNIPGLDEIPSVFLGNVPLLVTIIMGILYTVPQVKELTQHYAVFLHNAQYRSDDERILQIHLENCKFLPTNIEIDSNTEYLQEFDVYITDRNTDIIKLDTVGSWRKVCSLLRTLKGICRSERGVLSPRDCEELSRLEDAHKRKTRLAMSIIRMLDHMQKNGKTEEKLTKVSRVLEDVPHRDRTAVEMAEIEARRLAAEPDWNKDDNFQKPLRLSSHQLGEYLAQIERYFIAEYKMILHSLSALIAKVIIRSGDQAEDRLQLLKVSGFKGLGAIDQVNFDRVIWVLLTTWGTVFAGFLLTGVFSGSKMMGLHLIVSIAITVSIAALIGAMWGSRRTLIECRTTPWSSYLLGGLFAVLGFITVHGVRYLLDPKGTLAIMAQRHPDAANWTFQNYIGQILPWSIGVLFLTIGICRLARIESWKWANNSPIKERLTDGAITAFIYFCGGIFALLTHLATGTAFGNRIEKLLAGEGDPSRLIYMQGQNLIVGFIIGALVISEVRHIAHSHVITGTRVSGEATDGEAGASEARATTDGASGTMDPHDPVMPTTG